MEDDETFRFSDCFDKDGNPFDLKLFRQVVEEMVKENYASMTPEQRERALALLAHIDRELV